MGQHRVACRLHRSRRNRCRRGLAVADSLDRPAALWLCHVPAAARQSSSDLARHDLPPGPRLDCGFDPVRLEPNNVGSIGPEAFGVTTDSVATSGAASLNLRAA